MIAAQISHFAIALLATVCAVAEAKSCKAPQSIKSHHHHTKHGHNSTAVGVSLPYMTPDRLPSTTLATPVQPTIQSSQVKAAEAALETSSSNPIIAQSEQTEAVSTTASTAAAAVQSASTETFYGLGTRYGDSCTEENCWQDGACSFVDYELPAGIDGSTCVSDDIWENGANCGGCISVTYKGKTLKIMVTNRTGGNATHLDMTPGTWSKLTNGYSGGSVNGIAWEWITCPLPSSTPLQVHMHGGASQYWFAATIENATLRTKKLDVSSDEGATWKTATLHDPNMWEITGTLPSATCWVRVTSVNGDEVIVKDVALQSGKITKATENY
ncbi:expansin-like protein 5 [Colletotrichum spaethianum]|uniref:Expansin-like protein 5 n=1 Tax=Colletotrichum spaethianum TaxID=700344 RepID=A0AA37PFQ8_9PEZI|nr:expansin-like protein 5 [Colletotrichum spaethianum]GKT51358.1 expansin-like protein 5 [Colletotrichum spaethianum]